MFIVSNIAVRFFIRLSKKKSISHFPTLTTHFGIVQYKQITRSRSTCVCKVPTTKYETLDIF